MTDVIDLKRKTEIKIDLHRLVGDQVESGIHDAVQRWHNSIADFGEDLGSIDHQSLANLEDFLYNAIMGKLSEYIEF